jgi:hypothetical protein
LEGGEILGTGAPTGILVEQLLPPINDLRLPLRSKGVNKPSIHILNVTVDVDLPTDDIVNKGNEAFCNITRRSLDVICYMLNSMRIKSAELTSAGTTIRIAVSGAASDISSLPKYSAPLREANKSVRTAFETLLFESGYSMTIWFCHPMSSDITRLRINSVFDNPGLQGSSLGNLPFLLSWPLWQQQLLCTPDAPRV